MPETRSKALNPGLVLTHVVLIVGAIVMALPYVIQVITSLKSYQETIQVPPVLWPAHFQWGNYLEIFSASFPVGVQLMNTTLAAAARAAGQLLLGSMAAYAFARLKFRFRGAIFAVFLSVLMVPGQLFLIPQYQVIQTLGWLDSLQALFLPGIFSAFGVFLLRQYFMTLPLELDEAARLDGCNPFQIYWHILLPLVRPALVALALLTVVNSWNDLLWPLVVNSSPEHLPVSAGLANLQGQFVDKYQLIMAGAVLTTAPIILLFAVLQRQFIAGFATSGLK
ncbi:carbohydrate ABC transporter permease [Leifsonia sp. SIMBA_070]|uniref:carbohydrate ABC transporter permease n=1 Tax=Leifsonia sp. SIMBA_070 TaxID=3085810 RepID=UPI00397D77EB